MLTHWKEEKGDCFCITQYLPFAMHFPCLCIWSILLAPISKNVCVLMKPDGSLCNHTSKEGVKVEREGGDFGRMEPVEESAPLP